MNIRIEQMKPVLGNTEQNLLKMVELIEKGIEAGDDIIVFPELALNGYMLEDIVFETAMKNVPEILLEKSKEISIIFGMAELGEEEYPYNTAYYLEDGKIIYKHRKVYLPDYGMFSEGRYFAEGEKIRAFNTKFGRMGMLICEDAWHQSAHYILAQDGAKYIFSIANAPARLGMNKTSVSATWKALLKSSSISNGIFNIMTNRVGVEDGVTFFGNSAVIDPAGEIIKEAEYFKEETLCCCINPCCIRRVRTSAPVFKAEKLDLAIRELKRIQKNRFE